MIPVEEIRDFLVGYAEHCPRKVIPRVNQNDLVFVSWSSAYEVDDVNIYKRLGDFPEGVLPYTRIFSRLKPEGIITLFDKEGIRKDGVNVLPFSRAFELGIGQCLEASLLAQLSVQDSDDIFIICGGFNNEEFPIFDYHAFNIFYIEDMPYIIDVRNPIVLENGMLKKYIASIKGLDEEFGEFIISKEERYGRRYSL